MCPLRIWHAWDFLRNSIFQFRINLIVWQTKSRHGRLLTNRNGSAFPCLRLLGDWIPEPSGKYPNFSRFPLHYNELHDHLMDRWHLQCPKSIALRRESFRWNQHSPNSLSEAYSVCRVGGQKTLSPCDRSGPIMTTWTLADFDER
jgi:hypothetical protein